LWIVRVQLEPDTFVQQQLPMVGLCPDLPIGLVCLLDDPTGRTSRDGFELGTAVDKRFHALQIDPLIVVADDEAGVGLTLQPCNRSFTCCSS